MSGTVEGGRKAAITNKLKHNEDFYQRIGAKGGKKGTTGGFGNGEVGRKLASEAGYKGGRISKPTNPWGHRNAA
jgi:general stress protein YciG